MESNRCKTCGGLYSLSNGVCSGCFLSAAARVQDESEAEADPAAVSDQTGKWDYTARVTQGPFGTPNVTINPAPFDYAIIYATVRDAVAAAIPDAIAEHERRKLDAELKFQQQLQRQRHEVFEHVFGLKRGNDKLGLDGDGI